MNCLCALVTLGIAAILLSVSSVRRSRRSTEAEATWKWKP